MFFACLMPANILLVLVSSLISEFFDYLIFIETFASMKRRQNFDFGKKYRKFINKNFI